MKLYLKHKNKKIELDVKKCNWFLMFRGLMFRRRENAPALLLFDFKKPRRLKIHSLFVFFPFAAFWFGEGDKVIEMKIVKPWTLCVLPKKNFYRLVEIPLNSRYLKILSPSVIRKI